MNSSALIRAAAVTIFVVLVVAIAVLAMRGRYVGVRAGKADENYLKSTDCRLCHEGHYDSWRRTHHSRMTQDISPGTVQGDFERNNTYEYLGVKAKMYRNGAAFVMDLVFPDGRAESYSIERTVGSRRIEQYVTRVNGQYYRLPLAYDLVHHRWMSLNGSFFYPDGTDFKQHWASWDQNCVFCHNVKAQPNFNFQTNQARTEVSELGIACGACHGQGAEHAEAAASPWTRALWRATGGETKIVDPLEIDSDRSMMICGHCHGQRVPEPTDRIREILGRGDPYNAGDDLAKFYRPVHAGTTIGPVSFANRFWADGSPRLTAYEYQGILDSPCYLKGEKGKRINCLSCHTMHGGDVKGQITEEMRTNTACTQCHSELNDPSVLTNHTKHAAGSPGSSCYACHMPQVVYGIQAIHKTHKISIPSPAMTAEKQVPNACTQCHVDRSVNWAILEAKAMWPEFYRSSIPSPDRNFDLPEGIRGLFSGDALMRSLMADALHRHGEPEWARPFLVEAFAGDNYPIVRYFAANALAAAGSLQKPDYLAAPDKRSAQIALWAKSVDPGKLAEANRLAAELRRSRKDVDIEVGE